MAGIAAGAVLLLGLAACAPEPGSEAGAIDKGEETINPETQWDQANEEAEKRSTTLPDTFPDDEFALPEGATIFDAGERGSGTWFLVLEASSAADADALWNGIISTNDFEVSEEDATAEGGVSATLTGLTLNITAVTLPREDDTVLLNYDITRWG